MVRRSREEIKQERAQIESVIRSHPEGISLSGIIEEFAMQTQQPLPERTMLRRLETLQIEGRIRSDGQTTAARYFATPTNTEKVPVTSTTSNVTPGAAATGIATPTEEATEGYIPLTAEGEAVLALITQPMVARRPVGYREKFLRDYIPGKTWYLPARARATLHEMGRTPEANRAAGTFAHEIFERLLIDLAWASSALEGNTYTRLDTKNLLEYGVRAEGKGAAEAQMILNHKKAIELLVDRAEEIGFNRYTLSNLHAALSENLLDDPQYEGRLRTRIVHVTGTAFVPVSIPQKIEELFDLMLEKVTAIRDPFEQAFFMMVHLPYLQPFDDVNKRTSRLAANIPLIKQNLIPLSFIGLPHKSYVDGLLAVYEFNRIELLRDVFLVAYRRSCDQYRVVRESLGEPNPIRLQYRVEIAGLIRDVVEGGEAPQLGLLRAWAQSHQIPDDDQDRFAETALELLLALHEGSTSRYGLRRSEFEKWRARLAATE